MRPINVLMIGPARDVKGGMTSVIDSYYDCGLDKKIDLKYIETINDKNILCKICKMIKGYIEFNRYINKCDILHIHMASRLSSFRKGIYVRKAKKYNKKVIIHIHGAEYKVFYEKECNCQKRKYIIKTLDLADKIIVLSEEWKDYFSKLTNNSKIEILYNAIKIPDDFKKNLETQKALFLGRLGKRKGIYDLIEVSKDIIKKYPKFHLYIGGDGEVETVKTIITKQKLNKNIHYIGWIKDKEKERYLKECSIYILPSYNEGMPMSLIEGMSYKNISISTKVGGIYKVIENEENGLLIEPGNNEELYNAIDKVLSNRQLRIKLSKNARKTVDETFNIEKNIKKLLDLYVEL